MVYSFASTILAIGAFFFMDSIPFTHASFEVYASLAAIISPLAAFSLNLNFPDLSQYHSKTGSAIKSLAVIICGKKLKSL